MSESEYTSSYGGVSRMLRAPFVQEALLKQGVRLKNHAEDMAPVDETSDHPGRYRDNFKIREGVHNGRAEVVVYNDSPESIFVEKGTIYQAAQNVLLRAMQRLREVG